jgi:hypothetical protein
MENEDLINGLKNLISFWERNNNPSSSSNVEIRMWRMKYLESQNFSKEEAIRITHYFMSIPSDQFIEKFPEVHIEEIRKWLDNFPID